MPKQPIHLYDYNPETGIMFRGKYQVNCKTTNGYYRSHAQGKFWLVHRLAFEIVHGYVPETVDHINGVRTDNRIINLRAATQQQQCFNRRAKGYSLCKKTGIYKAIARINGVQKWLGYHDTAEKARATYLKFIKEHHGEFFTDRVN